ncbi:unnamed protein product [Hymenolepis diminuta]|uniref:CRAL-TRIO domain-containing protein n=1 Tax=Hymenolepis diminuta TaxID=6216 RepID=A0A564YI71_HYMDI|nr:unnamed protein product [Hymenolepis diminuta]
MSKKTSSSFKPFTLYDPSQPLSQVYKKRAAKELKEDPAQVSAHLESLKRWIKSMPHLKCTTDDDFLLAFLRQAKFNHMKAQARLDKFCTFRTHPTEGYPEWFKDTPRRREYWEKWLKLKSWTPLGFTQDGVMVAMMKWESFDLCEMTMEDLQSSFQLWTDYCLLDPRAQIGGLCMIMDLTGLKKETMMKMFDSRMAKSGTKYFQECLPFRINKLVYYNMPKFFEGLFKLYVEWFNEKIRSKVSNRNNFLFLIKFNMLFNSQNLMITVFFSCRL